jgi:hypothetical protein
VKKRYGGWEEKSVHFGGQGLKHPARPRVTKTQSL